MRTHCFIRRQCIRCGVELKWPHGPTTDWTPYRVTPSNDGSESNWIIASHDCDVEIVKSVLEE